MVCFRFIFEMFEIQQQKNSTLKFELKLMSMEFSIMTVEKSG